MSILLTNVNESLNKELIAESFKILKNSNHDEVSKIFFIDEESNGRNWDFSDINTTNFPIAIENNTEIAYDEITNLLDDIFDTNEFVNVIVDTTFLGYIILEIIIKKFNIKEAFIFENGKIKLSHPCSCGPEFMGV